MSTVMVATRECRGCGRALPFDDYYRHPHGKDGLRSKCKDCLGVQTAEWRERNTSRVEQYERERNATYAGRYGELNRRLSRARQRAYRALADRHPDEFEHLLIVERALEGLDQRKDEQ